MTSNKFTLGRDLDVVFNGETIFHMRSKYQDILILDTAHFGRMLFLDNSPQLSEKDECIYHESMAHPIMLAHGKPKDILIIGGGDGGMLREMLKYPASSITLCDIDAEVVNASRKYLPVVSKGAFDDDRATIVHADGKEYLTNADRKWDIIVFDITDPMGPSVGLFTREFYALAKSRLSGNGLLVFDADGPDYGGHFAGFVRTVGDVFPFAYPYLVFIPSLFIRQGFVICSANDLSFMKDPGYVRAAMDTAGIDFRFLTPEIAAGFFTRDGILDYIMTESAGAAHISTDDKPLFHTYR